MKYDIFMSHNSKDKQGVRLLAEKLKDSGLQIWLDENELIPGQCWQAAIEKAILEARSVAVIVGSNGLGPWENPEMRMALLQFVDKNVPVIPVLLPGTPKEVELPLMLRTLTWVDLRDGISEDGVFKIKCGINRTRPCRHIEKQETGKSKQSLTRSLTIEERLYLKLGYIAFQFVLRYLPIVLSRSLKQKKSDKENQQ